METHKLNKSHSKKIPDLFIRYAVNLLHGLHNFRKDVLVDIEALFIFAENKYLSAKSIVFNLVKFVLVECKRKLIRTGAYYKLVLIPFDFTHAVS